MVHFWFTFCISCWFFSWQARSYYRLNRAKKGLFNKGDVIIMTNTSSIRFLGICRGDICRVSKVNPRNIDFKTPREGEEVYAIRKDTEPSEKKVKAFAYADEMRYLYSRSKDTKRLYAEYHGSQINDDYFLHMLTKIRSGDNEPTKFQNWRRSCFATWRRKIPFKWLRRRKNV